MQLHQQKVLEQKEKGTVKVVQLDDHDLMNINQSTKTLVIDKSAPSHSRDNSSGSSSKSKQKCKKKLHKRYFSLHKEQAILSSITNTTTTNGSSSTQSAKIIENPKEEKEQPEKLARNNSLKTAERKRFNDRRLLKRFGSLSTYDKEFVMQVFQDKKDQQ